MKRMALIHPVLYTFIAVFYLYLPVSKSISPFEMLRPLGGMLILLVFVALVLLKTVKNTNEAGVYLSLFVFAFYFERSVFELVFPVMIAILLIYFLFKRIQKRQANFKEVNIVLGLLGFALFLGGVVKFVQLLADIDMAYYQQLSALEKQPLLTELNVQRDENPDIYYLILDGYGRADILNELYGFDNSAFIDELNARGFVVPELVRSNYPQTVFSVSSTLNMDYFQSFAPGLDDSHLWWLLEPYVDESQTRLLLEEMDYQSVSFAVNWTVTDNHKTDIYYSPEKINVSEFENYLLSNTLLKMFIPLIDRIAYVPASYDAHRELINYTLDTLPNIANLPGDYFVYAHLLAFHPPFVFDENGSPINRDGKFSLNNDENYSGETERIEKYIHGYVGQMKYLNKRILEMVDEIVERSSTPPIIILQADHGPGMYVDFASIENTCLHERFSPFVAYYFPGVDEKTVPDDITLVNTFRVVFNEYFDANLPLLQNQYYFGETPRYPYRMQELDLKQIDQVCQ